MTTVGAVDCFGTIFDLGSKPIINALRVTFAICHAYYTFCRVHQILRVTPAMEGGLIDHVWSLEESVGLLDKKQEAA